MKIALISCTKRKKHINAQQESYIQKARGFVRHIIMQNLLQIEYSFFPQNMA